MSVKDRKYSIVKTAFLQGLRYVRVRKCKIYAFLIVIYSINVDKGTCQGRLSRQCVTSKSSTIVHG